MTLTAIEAMFEWSASDQDEPPPTEELVERIDEEIEARLTAIDDWATAADTSGSTDAAYMALGQTFQTVALIDAATQRVPRLLAKIQNWITRLQQALAKVVKATRAKGFSITVSLTGVSVTVDW